MKYSRKFICKVNMEKDDNKLTDLLYVENSLENFVKNNGFRELKQKLEKFSNKRGVRFTINKTTNQCEKSTQEKDCNLMRNTSKFNRS